MIPNGVSGPILTVPQAMGSTLGLRAGQVLQGRIVETGQGLALNTAGTNVPLSAETGLEAGQRVLVEVVQQGAQVSLSLAPQGAEAPTSPDAVPSALARVLQSALAALKAPQSLQNASALLPKGMPPSASAVELLLRLFVQRDKAGNDLATLRSSLKAAARAGGALGDAAHPVLAWVSELLQEELPTADRLRRHLGMARGGLAEARLARALSRGDVAAVAGQLRGELRERLMALLDNRDFMRFLSTRGEGGAFRGAAQGLLDRLEGQHVQNLHGGDRPYLYFEIPFAPDFPIGHAGIHIFGDGRPGGERFSKATARVVLDVATQSLGPLWIDFQAASERCSCRIQATGEEAVARLEEGKHDLEAALSAAGYGAAKVYVALWDGDRLRESALILSGFSGVDVEA
jgi:hypothetical protein